jgi:Uma2 family endonuclease
LLIEVLFPSTRQYELEEKIAAYAAIPSLQRYLVLEQHQPIAIYLRCTDQGGAGEDRWHSGEHRIAFLGLFFV